MSKTLYILVDDPSCYGGIQQFVRDLERTLSDCIEVKILAYFGTLSGLKACPDNVIRLNFAENRSRFMRIFLGGAETYCKPSLKRTLALLWDSFQIRKKLKKILSGNDILLINAFHTAHLFVPHKVLKHNTICFVQHNSPAQLYAWKYDFGGLCRNHKINLFNKYVDAMVFLSPFEQKEISGYLDLTCKHTAVIRHQTELPDVPVTATDRCREVMFLGRLVNKHKRIDRILQIAEAAPEFNFNIYGDGPDRDMLKKMAQHLKNVHFHGFVSDVSAAMQKNGIMIFTSDYEGYPIAGIESVAWGRPLAVLNSFPAAADLVENNLNGILLDEFCPEKFAAALRRIADDYGQYHQAALKIREKYDPEQIGCQWRDFILRLSKA